MRVSPFYFCNASATAIRSSYSNITFKSHAILQCHICSGGVENDSFKPSRNAALDLGIEVKMGGKGRSIHIVECQNLPIQASGDTLKALVSVSYANTHSIFCEGWSSAFFHQTRLHFFSMRDAVAAS